MNLRIALAPAILLHFWLGGCSHGLIEPNTAAPTSTDAFFIMGVSNEDTRVGISAGTVDERSFTATNDVSILSKNLAFEGVVHNGYIVGKVPADTPLGLVFLQTDDNALYSPCMLTDLSNTLVFNAKAGKVIYIADIEMVRYYQKLKPNYRSDIQRARAFLSSHYPNLAGSLEPGTYRMLHSNKC